MSGNHAGLHVLLREHMPRGVYIHCSAHRLNLVISDTCKVVKYLADYFAIVSHIHSFFTESGVTNVYFKQAQKQLGLGNHYSNPLLLKVDLCNMECEFAFFSTIVHLEAMGKYSMGFSVGCD